MTAVCLKDAQFAFERSCDAVDLMIEHYPEPRDWLPVVWFRALRHLSRDLHVPIEAHDDFDFLVDVLDSWIHVSAAVGLRIRSEVTDAQLIRAAASAQVVAEAIITSYGVALDEAVLEAKEIRKVAGAAFHCSATPLKVYAKEDSQLACLREWSPPVEQPKN